MCKDGSKIYNASLLQRSRPLVCSSKVPSLTDEELRHAKKEVESVLKQKALCSYKHRRKYNDYTPGKR